jgi:ribonucleoside-diphosphate reductase alpha chain
VQGNQLEPVLQYFKQFNPQAVEKSVWSANGTDEIISFVMEVQDGAKTKNQLSAIDLLEYVRLTQQNWVLYGKNEQYCTQDWLCHNVSNTISVRPNEWDDVADYIFRNRKWFAGISLLPMSGDLDYPQAPFVTVHTPAEILREYGEGAMFASGLIVDGLHAFDNNLWAACDAVNGLGSDLSVEPTNGEYDFWYAKVDWIRRVKQFAERYLNSDVRRTTYLLKEVNNWKAFVDLRRDYKPVPYEEMYEAENTIQHSETIACSGGACSIYV